jgi:hypothetical protein
MASPTFALQKSLDDPLEYLPCSSITEHRKGQMIYNHDQAVYEPLSRDRGQGQNLPSRPRW